METEPPPAGNRRTYRRHFIREKKAPPPLVLQPRDMAITTAVYENRFLTLELLAALFPPDHNAKARRYNNDPARAGETHDLTHSNLRRRLRALFHHGYLDRFHTHIGGEHIYALDTKGAQLIRDQQLPLPLSIDWTEKNRDISTAYAEHALMVARFRTALTVALKVRPALTLPHFERESKDLKAEWKRQGARVFVVPDAFFILRDESQPEGRQRAAFFLEADRSTMQLSRLLEKYARYSAMYHDQIHRERFNVPNFRVLTLTKSKERAANILTLATAEKSPLPKAHRLFFYFASEEAYHEHPENLLAAIWQRADDPKEPRALIGSPLPLR